MKTVLIIILVAGRLFTSYAQTAPDIAPVDCHGGIHNLYENLDAGKIIVVGWTMPCSACVPPLLEVHDAVSQFATSHPGVVEFWVNDDVGDSDCNMVTGWSEFYGITQAEYFSSTLLTMDDFGTYGMPKVVVIGCADHTVYYNVNDAPTGAGVTSAINQALSDIANDCLLGLSDEAEMYTNEVLPFPIPADEFCSFTVAQDATVETIELISLNGKRIILNEWSNENNLITIDVAQFENGIYFLSVGFHRDSPEYIRIEIRHL